MIKTRFYSFLSKTLYDRLGVSADSSLKEIKSAYYRKSLECHPDVGGSAEEFQAIKEAYEILSDSNRRLRYNNRLAKSNFTGFQSNEDEQSDSNTEELSPTLVISVGILLAAGAAFGLGIYYHTFIEKSPKLMQEDINNHRSRAFVLENTPQDFYKLHHGPGWRYRKKP